VEPEDSPPTKARLPGETPSMLLVIITATVSRFRYEKRKTSNRVMRPDPTQWHRPVSERCQSLPVVVIASIRVGFP